MTMIETPTETPKPKRKYTRKRKAAAAPKPVSEFAGISAADCPAACKEGHCVISGRFYCGHPYKGGLQGRDMGDEAAVERLAKAKKMLGKKKLSVIDA